MAASLSGLPRPMQPLKAMAVLVITQKLSAGVLSGAGLAIGVIMLALSLSGALDWVAARIPRCVVRGIQFGLGLSLCSLALKNCLPADGLDGYALAAVGFVIVLLLRQSRRFPAALFVIALGVIYALLSKVDAGHIAAGVGLALPKVQVPEWNPILTGLVALALPQLPLSLSNSVIATHQTVRDLFPERAVSVRRVGVTYGLVNVVNSFSRPLSRTRSFPWPLAASTVSSEASGPHPGASAPRHPLLATGDPRRSPQCRRFEAIKLAATGSIRRRPQHPASADSSRFGDRRDSSRSGSSKKSCALRRDSIALRRLSGHHQPH